MVGPTNPTVSPTVLCAEVTSKMMSTKLVDGGRMWTSEITPRARQSIHRKAITAADVTNGFASAGSRRSLPMRSGMILCGGELTLSICHLVARNRSSARMDFSPPPVEPIIAPTNMAAIKMSLAEIAQDEISVVWKPVVVAADIA